MFEHLIHEPPVFPNPEQGFTYFDQATPELVIDGQVGTVSWLEELGAISTAEVLSNPQAEAARFAFKERTTGQTPEQQKKNLLMLSTPLAVRQHVAMLTQYDWDFVNQAKELRGYVVAKLLEDSKSPDARHRLRALEMLGKVTEVGLFTERVHITKVDLTDEALEKRIKDKLDKFRHVIDITDVIENTAPVGAASIVEEVSTNFEETA